MQFFCKRYTCGDELTTTMLLQLLLNVSRFTRLDNGGDPTMGDTLSMPDGTSTGTLWDPPSGEACCGGVY
jgi:hypothetical protein